MTKNNKIIGLALSGGGYRAAAFHVGTLNALNKLGLLKDIDVISSVSGGSITAAYYALNKDNFGEFEKSFVKKLSSGVLWGSLINALVVLAIIVLCFCLVSWWTGLLALLALFAFWYKVLPFSRWISIEYDWKFFKKKLLKDLPNSPIVSINATDLATANQFYFSKEYIGNFRHKYESFNAKELEISKAVMASSCVPFAFSPIRIPKKYLTTTFNSKEKPLLFDGGLYDNQGTHCLTDKYSKNPCDYIVVSDAGNTTISNRWTINPIAALIKTANVLMRRINNMQVQENIYNNMYPDKRFAYIKLEWDVTERLINGFIDNLKKGNVKQDVIACHHITKEDIEELKHADTEKDARQRLENQLKVNIRWDELSDICPSQDEHIKAHKVSTNLIGLRENSIKCLIKHAEWMTMVQVRLYLPMCL